MMLTEARGGMRDAVANARLDAALKKVVHKIEKNQRDNGSWDDNGWAPVLSQAIAAKGLNRAAQNGATVSPVVLERVEQQARQNFDATARTFTSAGAAGVEIYGAAASSATARDSAATKNAKAAGMKAAQAATRPCCSRRRRRPTPRSRRPRPRRRGPCMAADETDHALVAAARRAATSSPGSATTAARSTCRIC